MSAAMGWLFSVLVFTNVSLGLGFCVGFAEGFVQTLYIDDRGKNRRPLTGHLLLALTCLPWLLCAVSTRLVERFLLRFLSKKCVIQMLLLGLAAGVYTGSTMVRTNVNRVVGVFMGLQFLTSVTFCLFLSLVNDCLTAEGGPNKQAFAWGLVMKANLLGIGVASSVVSGFATYAISFKHLHYASLSVIYALVAITLKSVPPSKQNNIEAEKKNDIQTRTANCNESGNELDETVYSENDHGVEASNGIVKRRRKRTRSDDITVEETTTDSVPSQSNLTRENSQEVIAHQLVHHIQPTAGLSSQLMHVLRVSGTLLLYVSLRRVPELITAWELAPYLLTRLGVQPMFAAIGFPVGAYTVFIFGVFIATYSTQSESLEKHLSAAGSLGPFVLLYFVMALLGILPTTVMVHTVMYVVVIFHIISGAEICLMMLCFFKHNAQLPPSLRLLHISLFAIADKLAVIVVYPAIGSFVAVSGIRNGCVILSMTILVVSRLAIKLF